jgi:hypothetical protein
VVEHKQTTVPSGQADTRRFRWRHRPVVIPLEPAATVRTENGRIVIVQERADFVCCSYKGCGALRPIAEAAELVPCAVCGRV